MRGARRGCAARRNFLGALRSASSGKRGKPLESGSIGGTWPKYVLDGVEALWELLKDEDVALNVRRDVATILEWSAEYAENGKLRVYEHGDLASWDAYLNVLDDITVPPGGTGGCNRLAHTLAYPPKMRALLEAHPTLYDAVARMREDVRSCWSSFDDATKAAIDAMLGRRGYQMAAALSSHAPSLLAAVALAKTLHGEAEAVVDDYQALFASPSLPSPAWDLVAATVKQAAERGELEKMRDSMMECQTRLKRVAKEEGKYRLLLQEGTVHIGKCIHKAVKGIFQGYERIMGILEVVHGLQAAHDLKGGAPNTHARAQELRGMLFATETLATSETSPFSAHETNRLAQMRPNQ